MTIMEPLCELCAVNGKMSKATNIAPFPIGKRTVIALCRDCNQAYATIHT